MRVILWDLDGTLADTQAVHFTAWQNVMNGLGVEYTHDMFLHDFGQSNGEVLTRLLGTGATPATISAISRRKEMAFRALLPEAQVTLLPGVQEWLTRFQSEGVRQVVSSSGAMANIVALIAKLEIGDFFMSLMSAHGLAQAKPHPAIFLNSAAAVGASPADCIVIEDSLAGVEAARRAGMACIAVGRVSTSPNLQRLITSIYGPPCLPLGELTALTSHDVEILGNAALGTFVG